MGRAIARAAHSRLLSPPNPWVGSIIVAPDGTSFEGATQRPGGRHAERMALDAAGRRAEGSTLYTTLEPCSHHGRTGPCTDAIIEAGINTVVMAIEDPDPKVAGSGAAQLRAAGIEVIVGPGSDEVEAQLAPYLHHRRTGRPYVVLKLATTLDGHAAAPDGTSQWITGDDARRDAHRLRAESDAILVGAGTVRADNPRLNVRDILAADGLAPREPLRVVLGSVPTDAAIHPCLEMSGDLGAVLDDLGGRNVLQLMVEGGPSVAADFHRKGLVDRYVLYLAPALMQGTETIADLRRGTFQAIRQVGADLRLDFNIG